MKKRILSVLVTLMLVSVLMPTAVFAAGVTGNVTSNNNAPVVNSIAISTMTPNVAHTLSMSITDDNLLSNIDQIDIVIFYDADGNNNGVPGGAWDCDEEAIYKWVDDGDGTWSMEDGDLVSANHTWALGTGTEPTMTGTTGTWILDFTPGKLAIEAVGGAGTNPEWDVKVTVTDLGPLTHNLTVYSTAMSAYSSIATDIGSITFGAGVALGATAYIDTPVDHNFATQVLANDAYALQSNSAATWTGAGTLTLDPDGTPSAAGQFALNIDDAGDGAGVPTLEQPVTTSAANITGHATDPRVATADGANEAVVSQNLYMSLKLYSTGSPVGAYSGTITLTVVN